MKIFVLFLFLSLTEGEPQVAYRAVPDCSVATVAAVIKDAKNHYEARGYTIHDVDGACEELSVELPGDPA